MPRYAETDFAKHAELVRERDEARAALNIGQEALERALELREAAETALSTCQELAEERGRQADEAMRIADEARAERDELARALREIQELTAGQVIRIAEVAERALSSEATKVT